MKLPQILIFLALVVILGVPFALRPASDARRLEPGERPLVVITPHVPQIQEEFTKGFDRWHRRVHGKPAHIDWRQPGGTSDIQKVLDASYASEAASDLARRARTSAQSVQDAGLAGNELIGTGSMAFDIFIGGGSYEHGQLKTAPTQVRFRAWQGSAPTTIPISKPTGKLDEASLAQLKEITTDTVINGQSVRVVVPITAIEGGSPTFRPFLGDAVRIDATVDLSLVDRVFAIQRSEPAGFAQPQLDAWFGENKVGAQLLYDPQQFWIGTALSGFGIVYNREVLNRLDIPEPTSFRDLANPKLAGWVTFADPRQSGSAGTSLDAILSREGWDNGWKLLREMCANARSFTNSSPKPPIDVSHGEAAMGLAIDFYGRGQSQAIAYDGPHGDRVGYVDPKGETYIDADPVSILRGCPNPELARRFVEFCLSDEGQALWQFHATSTPAGANNPKAEDGKPMGPIRHELRRMPVKRSFYAAFQPAMIDQVNPFDLASDALPAGWRSSIPIMMGAFAIDNFRDLRDAWSALNAARASGDSARVAEMERLFYAFPDTTTPDGKTLAFTPANYKAISATWKEPGLKSRCEIEYTTFFRNTYRKVVELGNAAPPQ